LDVFLTRLKKIASQEGPCLLKVFTFLCYKFGLVRHFGWLSCIKNLKNFCVQFFLRECTTRKNFWNSKLYSTLYLVYMGIIFKSIFGKTTAIPQFKYFAICSDVYIYLTFILVTALRRLSDCNQHMISPLTLR